MNSLYSGNALIGLNGTSISWTRRTLSRLLMLSAKGLTNSAERLTGLRREPSEHFGLDDPGKVTAAAETLRWWAHNPECLRAAVAAHMDLTDAHFIRADSSLLPAMTRGIIAFADEVSNQRRGLKTLRPSI